MLTVPPLESKAEASLKCFRAGSVFLVLLYLHECRLSVYLTWLINAIGEHLVPTEVRACRRSIGRQDGRHR